MLMKYRLFTPGPTSVPEATLLTLARPVHHHRTADFRATFARVQEGLKLVYQTTRPVHVVTGSGTGAFEAGLASTLSAGSRVLNVCNGKFAERWGQMARTFGMEVTELKLEYGRHVSAGQLEGQLRAGRFDAVMLVHSETSTATVCDLEAIARVVRGVGGEQTLLIVDGITSIGALPFRMDQWGVDVAVTGSQKALMLPPGLGFVALSERAERRMLAEGRGQPEGRGQGEGPKQAAAGSGGFYFDLRKSLKALPDGDTPFTPANTLIEALETSLEMLRREGMETVWKRTAASAAAFRAGMQALGLSLFSQSPADSVTAVNYPAGVTDKAFRNTLRDVHNIHVAGGQGSMEGKLFRVNHMGYSDIYDVLAVTAAVEHTLKALKIPFSPGAGVTACHRVLSDLF